VVALTVLALEELAKIPDPYDTASRAKISRSDLEWPAFWKRCLRNGSKREAIARYGARLVSLSCDRLDRLEQLVRVDHVLGD
jgi:hypothetical protein